MRAFVAPGRHHLMVVGPQVSPGRKPRGQGSFPHTWSPPSAGRSPVSGPRRDLPGSLALPVRNWTWATLMWRPFAIDVGLPDL